MQAAGYVRVSSEEQVNEGFSLAAQRRQITAFCEAKGWTLGHVYADEGISGKEMKNRPALQQLLAAAQAHKFDVVVITNLDRLSRTTLQILALVADHFSKNSVRLVSINEGIDPTTVAGEFVLTVLAGLAQLERRQLGERTRMGMQEARLQGKHIGKPPYGWRIGDDGRLMEVPDQQTVLDKAAVLTRRHGPKEAARLLGWPLTSLKDRMRKQEVFQPTQRKPLAQRGGG